MDSPGILVGPRWHSDLCTDTTFRGEAMRGEIDWHDEELRTRADQAVAFARRVLEPNAAVILDAETATLGGPICELAVIDAATGQILIDTLVNPMVPIAADTTAIHGLTDSVVSAPGVPTWPSVYAQLVAVASGRIVLAYNASYDLNVVVADCRRYSLDDSWITMKRNWEDVMAPRSHYAYSRRWLRNEGGHRALGDVQQTRNHLMAMTTPPTWPQGGQLEVTCN